LARPGEPIEKRLWGRSEHKPSGCIVFTGSTNAGGHGQIHYNGRNRRTHTVSWELSNGPIPDGMQVNHHCDNPPCINPEHLYLGTQSQNMADMNARGRNVLGSQTGTAKLTELDALAIFHAPGTHKDIARMYGVCRQTVGLIKNRINWAWLTQDEPAA
jgi:hypothetical protein